MVRIDVKFDEKAMTFSLEQEPSIPPEEELIAPKEEPQTKL